MKTSNIKTSKKTFSVDEPWLDHLTDHGYVIIRDVLSKDEVTNTVDSLWKTLGSLDSGIDRNNSETWTNDRWPGWKDVGFLQTNSISQSDPAWSIRGNSSIKRIFSRIWATNDLLVSLDTFIAWRPWSKNKLWKPKTENIHVDQNPFFKQGHCCTQGMMVLKDVNLENGGLMVVPDTNNDETQAYIRREYPYLKDKDEDWGELDIVDPLMEKRLLLEAPAGSLILWDSRTVHGGLVGTGYPKILSDGSHDTCEQDPGELARLAFAVCMVPKSFAKDLDTLGLKRTIAYNRGKTLTHWPAEYNEHLSGGFMGPKFDADIHHLSMNELKLLK
jgi:ectoine hydroxylase-related dioxygenase (phytanoyl-CoA dioxygenase family)